MDLEVDQRWRDAQEKITDSHPSERILVPDEVTLKPSLAISHAKQTRSSRFFFFFIGLAVGIALVAIVAGVAGSIAVQRQSKLNSCIQAKNAETTGLSCSCPNTSNPTNSTAAAPSIHDIKPTSECRKLSSPMTSSRGSVYSLECGIDLIEEGKDLVGVYVYTFTDCVNACAFYNDPIDTGGHGNSTCYAVSFNFALPADQGNCWFKGHQKIPFHSNETVDSAILDLS